MSTKNLSYNEAKSLRQSGFSGILSDTLLSDNGIASSVGKSISLSTRASLLGLKEKFDPLNIARGLTGGSNIGPALLGKIMGRSSDDIKYFTGQSKTYSKTASQKSKSPFYLYTVNRGMLPIRTNDSLATCLNKLYNLIVLGARSSHERQKIIERSLHTLKYI